ncbi:MAG: putative porin [Acidobacteriota bacterium]
MKVLGSLFLLAFFSLSFLSQLTYAHDNGEGESKKSTATPTTEEQILFLKQRIERLEELIDRQQQLIDSLSKNTTAAPATVEPAQPVQPATVSTPPVSAIKDDDNQRKLDSLVKNFGSLKLSGDLRIRYDGQYNQGFDAPVGLPERNRLRGRVRLQLAGEINKNFDWAIRFGSGSFTTPVSLHQSFTDFFTRKPVGFDRYFIRYNSNTEPIGVVLQAGKFDYPWKRTELTFDNDLQVEGAAETVYIKSKGFFKEGRLTAFQLPFSEVSVGKDSYLLGGSFTGIVGNTNWLFSGTTTFLNFNRADALARSLGRPSTQVGGGLELVSTNRLRRDAAGNVIGFVANFNLLDVIGELTYRPASRFPLTFVGNYVRNMTDRVSNEKNGYWAELRVGRLKEKGDIELGYTFIRTEQDAVLSPFNYSVILGTTNSRANRVAAGYMINNNVFFQVTSTFFRRFNVIAGNPNRTQARLQLDMNYKF